MIAMFKKEMFSYFTTVVGYVFLGFFLLFTGATFIALNLLTFSPDYFMVLAMTSATFLILIPILTMRIFSEEIKQKTDQLLYTAPVPVWQIVVGKYLAAFSLFVIGLGITVLYPFLLTFVGNVPIAQVTTAYVGYMLVGACFISIGIFVSVLTENQIVAAIATFVILAIIYFMLPWFAQMAPSDSKSSLVFIGMLVLFIGYLMYNGTKNMVVCILTILFLACICGMIYAVNPFLYSQVVNRTLLGLALVLRFENFSKGILNFSDVIYYVTFSIAFIFFTIGVIEKRRWS